MDTEEGNQKGRVEENPQGKQDISHTNDLPGAPNRTGSPQDGQSSHKPIPGDVLCDSCIESPSEALKSCLTCLVSYCEGHLRPHLENPKFVNHRLVEPLYDIECRMCEVHQIPLELFCLKDGGCVCRDCGEQEHRGHPTSNEGSSQPGCGTTCLSKWWCASPRGRLRHCCADWAQQRQIEEEGTELQKEQLEIVQGISAANKTIDKLQSKAASVKNSVDGVYYVIEQQFARLRETVEEAKKGAMDAVRGEQSCFSRQAEGIQAHLQHKKAELKKHLAQMERLARIRTDAEFLQEYLEWRKVDPFLPDMKISLTNHLFSISDMVNDATRGLCDLILTCYAEKMQEIRRSGIKARIQCKTPEYMLLSMPEPESQEDFRKYTQRLKFDPNTVHRFLRLTEDNTKLTNTSPWQHSYPDNDERFGYWRQAMTSESFYLGRHYFEAELSGEGAHIGVTYKSIDRKGKESSSCLTGNDFSWCLGRNRKGHSLWHADVETPLEVAEVTKVGVYINFYKGFIAFYHVTRPTMTLLHKYKVDFMEPLYATAWLSKTDNTASLFYDNT